LLLSCGDSTIRFCPALIVKRAEVDIAVGIFDAVLTELDG
jgi:4-aminobutyrate aminotransferase-like enzyme